MMTIRACDAECRDGMATAETRYAELAKRLPLSLHTPAGISVAGKQRQKVALQIPAANMSFRQVQAATAP